MGRPRLEFDPERACAVVDGLLDGHALDAACVRAGVSWDTVKRWRAANPGFEWQVRVASRRVLPGASIALSAAVFNEKKRLARAKKDGAVGAGSMLPWALIEKRMAEREAELAADDAMLYRKPDPTAGFGSTFDPDNPDSAF